MARWFVDRLPQQGIPSVSLRRLLPEAKFLGCQDWEVSGCTADSRRLDPGQVFVAVRGSERDGHEFVTQALERGAAGVVVERPCPEAGRLQVIVPDSREALARLCHALAGDPSDQLLTVGVTGTWGRTVTSLFLRAIFEATGVRFGLVGSLGWSDGVSTRSVSSTFPGAESLATMLSDMVEHGCRGGVVEVPPEALRDRHVEGIRFDVALATDSGSVGGLDSEIIRMRRQSKARLFRKVVPGGISIVSADDPLIEPLGAVNLDTRRISFGLERDADVTAEIERLDTTGVRFLLRGFDREASIHLRLPGKTYVSQALAAAAVAWSQGVNVDAVVAGLESVSGIPGRLESLIEGQDFSVWIDQARTGTDLQQALEAVRRLGTGQVHCILGAEGLRDRSERLALAYAAEHGADRVILTDDNPRTEDPNQILDDLLAGFRRPGRVRVESNRQFAIESTLASTSPGDVVLIAGKGARTYQILADHVIQFDDKQIASNWLRNDRLRFRRTSA
ncbi:Mur ligase family protein [Singulisphaera sp. PoT]|uniref:Mur ligase family protein n=1 Tax=Singulisphaera sp. PoT TaxID=3411797 RepID=UPI003BF5BC87